MEVAPRGNEVKRALMLAALALTSCRERTERPLRVAAASDLIDVFNALGPRFEAETKVRVEFSFGSSGLLAKQLSEGAPFDVFAAASRAMVDETVRAGACDADSVQQFARGRLVIWPRGTLDGVKGRVALANPEHAPYGRAAKEALLKSGQWTALEPRVVYAENVRQALQFVDTGNAEAGLVAWSNVVARDAGNLTLVDASLHAPIEQVIATCRRGKRTADAALFIEFLNKPESQEEFSRRGFELP